MLLAYMLFGVSFFVFMRVRHPRSATPRQHNWFLLKRELTISGGCLTCSYLVFFFFFVACIHSFTAAPGPAASPMHFVASSNTSSGSSTPISFQQQLHSTMNTSTFSAAASTALHDVTTHTTSSFCSAPPAAGATAGTGAAQKMASTGSTARSTVVSSTAASSPSPFGLRAAAAAAAAPVPRDGGTAGVQAMAVDVTTTAASSGVGGGEAPAPAAGAMQVLCQVLSRHGGLGADSRMAPPHHHHHQQQPGQAADSQVVAPERDQMLQLIPAMLNSISASLTAHSGLVMVIDRSWRVLYANPMVFTVLNPLNPVGMQLRSYNYLPCAGSGASNCAPTC